jgi:cyclase
MNSRSELTFAAATLALLLAPLAHAQFGAEPAELELIELREDLYVISNAYVPGLVTAMITGEGVVLVDDKYDVDHDNVMRLLRTVTSQPVRYVINTHHHSDHSGGNARLQALDAVVLASEQARGHMLALNQSGLPDFTLGEHATLYVGGKTVELYRVNPAHTDGDVIVLFPEHRVLAAGDIFANGPGTSAQFVDHAGGGSAKQWPKAVEAALALDFDTVVPGHGLVSTRADLEAYHERAERFNAVLSALVHQGKSRADIEAVLRADFDWEDFHIESGLDGLIDEYR